MSLTKVDSKNELSGEFDFSEHQIKRKINLINSESFFKSIEILKRFEQNFIPKKDLNLETCMYCKTPFYYAKTTNCKCPSCQKTLCFKHRQPQDHQCIKLTSNNDKYLAAKNLFKERLKAMKNKRS
ncbi:MAG: AN1-type zinc finger domain-containing protein [archaeon]|nr:AN1-type zinc finger domain-containing protein [archaeon]